MDIPVLGNGGIWEAEDAQAVGAGWRIGFPTPVARAREARGTVLQWGDWRG